MNKPLAVLALFACAAAPVLAADPAEFEFSRPVSGADLSAPQLVEVELDAPVMAATQTDFRDLRLFDGDDREIPRAIEPRYTLQERTVRSAVSAKVTDLRELPDNRIEARFELATGSPSPDSLTIRTPLKDFLRSIRVQGSPDGETWEPLVEDAEIHDYSRYMDIRRTDIPLPENSFRFFSIEIGNASEERAQPLIRLVQANGQDQSRAFDLLRTPFRIDGVSFWRDTTVIDKDKPVLREWPHAGLTAAEDEKARTTEILLQTGSAPLTRIVLETRTRNFQRTAIVQIPVRTGGQKTWRRIARGRFTCVDVAGLVTNALAIDFPEQRVPELRIRIQNADNPPLDITDLRTFGPTYLLLWLADPATAYRLAYGHDRLEPPAYDLFALRAALDRGIEPLRWKLGDPVAQTARRSFAIGDFLARPAVFGTALVVAALALLLLLAKALKKAT